MADEGREIVEYRRKVSSRQPDRALARLARNRHRVVTTHELLGLGFSPERIQRRLTGGGLVRRYRGVYVVGPGPLTADGELLAAALFAAPDGVVSHHPASRLLGLASGSAGGIIDVTCPRRIAAPRGIRAHRSTLPRDERTIWRKVPVTPTGRAIFDCAADSTARQIERMLNEAFVLGLPIKPPLATLLDRYPGRRGTVTARAALDAFEGGRTPTKSDLEERFVDFLDRHGFPRPLTDHPVETHRGTVKVDCAWPARRLAIEVDAPSTHGSRPRMLTDRRRDRALILAGWTPGRVMEEDLDDEPALAAEIGALLVAQLPDPARSGHDRAREINPLLGA